MGLIECMPQRMILRDEDEKVTPVWLHAYDLGTSCTGRFLNGVLRPLGTGAFHCGVEVYDVEWSYCEGGVFMCKPRRCPGHTFNSTVLMGTTLQPRHVVAWIIDACRTVWMADGYNVLNHNCCHFCEDLCHRLGVGTVPSWVMNLASVGNMLENAMCESECCVQERVEEAPEIIGAVGLGEIQESDPTSEESSPMQPAQRGRHSVRAWPRRRQDTR
mmetsp:Transcript_77345/g.230406  ORF Transcript_77345/g.230406 Transcript_77345/m.230406 type:complete len:216 (-) Transcript_77345:56-703(-)